MKHKEKLSCRTWTSTLFCQKFVKISMFFPLKVWCVWNKLEKIIFDCFQTRAKVRNLNYHSNCSIWMIIRIAQFEWSFELRNLNDHSNDGILDHVYAKLHRDVLFEMRNSNDGPDLHLNCAIQITHGDVTVQNTVIQMILVTNSNCAIRMISQIAQFEG